MITPLLLTIRTLRETVLSHAIQKAPAPADAAKKITELIPQITKADLDDRQLALLWGELQLILIDGEGRVEDSTAWGQIRNAADAALVGLLKRREWINFQDIFRRDIFGRLASAVSAQRDMRMQACIDATSRLLTIAGQSGGQEQRWLLMQLAGMQYPRFGTSGWRARMGVDFTWRRATAVAQAIIEFVIDSGLARYPLTIGYDSRINGDKVALLVADVAAANGLQVHLASRDTPSPALIYYITEQLGVAQNAGLINCTPSHNPVKDPTLRAYMGTEYHGIRYNMPYGGVAPSQATDAIGRRAMLLLLQDEITPGETHQRGKVSYFDPLASYTDALIHDLDSPVTLPDGARGDSLTQIRAFWGDDSAMVVIDEMHSASRGYLRALCEKLGIRYTVVHGEKDPLLGELIYANPEPPHINACQRTVASLRQQYPRIIGLGMDTDSDRFGVVDELGNYVMTNQMLPMLADYLLNAAYNGRPGRIIRNMVTTRMLDRVAEQHADKILPPPNPKDIVPHAAASNYQAVLGDVARQSGFLTYVVPVGFKYIAEVMMRDLLAVLPADDELDPARQEHLFHECLQQLLLAGEESNGMTSRGHTPDKDGLWGAMLTLQMCAVLRKPVRELWRDLVNTYGQLVSARRDIQAPNSAKTALVNCYLDRYAEMQNSVTYPDELMVNMLPVYCGGVRGELVEIIYQDEYEQESYVAIRASGTEPINRIYVECPTVELRDALMTAVGDELQRLIIEEIAQADNVAMLIELLESVELPPESGEALPATYNEAILQATVARTRGFAGENAEEVVRRIDAELGAKNAARTGLLGRLIE